jgi:hypothetical protein
MTNEQQTERPTLLKLYQEVEAATCREQVFKILKEYQAYHNPEPRDDRQRRSHD